MARNSLTSRDKNWPKRDDVRAAVPNLISQLGQARDLLALLDLIDADWAKRDEARAAMPRLIASFGKDKEVFAILDRIAPDWPKSAEAKEAVPRLTAWLVSEMEKAERDWEPVAQALDRVAEKWRESPEVGRLLGTLIERYFPKVPTEKLACLRGSWQDSPAWKNALNAAILNLAEKDSERHDLRSQVKSLNESPVGWRSSEEARAAIHTFTERLKTLDAAKFERTVAALDQIDRDWPRYTEAPRIVKALNARLAALGSKDQKQADNLLLLSLVETLDRIDPLWTRSDDAQQAAPKLVRSLVAWRGSRSLPDREVALLDRINPTWALTEIDAVQLRNWMNSRYDYKTDLFRAAAVLARRGEGERESDVDALVGKLADKALAQDAAAIRALGLLRRNAAVVVPKLVTSLRRQAEKDLVDALGAYGREAESAVPVLLGVLEASATRWDRSPDLARSTIRALGRIGAEPTLVVPEIARFLMPRYKSLYTDYYFHDAEEVGEEAACALSGFEKGAAIAELAKELSQHVRHESASRNVLQALGNLGPAATASVPELLEVVTRSEDADSIRALGQIGASPETVVPKLVPCLKSKRWQTRAAAAEALGRFGGNAAEAIPALLPLLLDDNMTTCRAGLAALDRIDGRWPGSAEKILPELVKRLDDPREYLRHEAVRVLGRFGPKATDATPKLLRLLDDPDTTLRRDTAGALVLIDPNWTQKVEKTRAVSLLAAALTDRSPAVRKKSAQALRGFGKDAVTATAPLVLLLADWDRGTVESAHMALKSINDTWAKTEAARKTVPLFAWRLNDRSAHVRANAARALGLFDKGAESAVTALVLRAADADRDVRGAARDALGRIDQEWPKSAAAKKAVARLESLRKSKDADIRKAAELLLMEVNPN